MYHIPWLIRFATHFVILVALNHFRLISRLFCPGKQTPCKARLFIPKTGVTETKNRGWLLNNFCDDVNLLLSPLWEKANHQKLQHQAGSQMTLFRSVYTGVPIFIGFWIQISLETQNRWQTFFLPPSCEEFCNAKACVNIHGGIGVFSLLFPYVLN